MTTTDKPVGEATITLHVPELKSRPVVGGGCCALPVEPLIADALSGLAGVKRVDVSTSQGQVVVETAEFTEKLAVAIADAIEAQTYHVTSHEVIA